MYSRETTGVSLCHMLNKPKRDTTINSKQAGKIGRKAIQDQSYMTGSRYKLARNETVPDIKTLKITKRMLLWNSFNKTA